MTQIDGWTYGEALDQLQIWKQAYSAVSTGQSYRIGTRELSRLPVEKIREQIRYFSNIINRFEQGLSGRSRGYRVVPRDL